MPSKRKRCQNWKLYVITDADGLRGRLLEDVVAQAIDGGADVIQLRDKKASNPELILGAKKILKITRSQGIPLIINDRVDVAQCVGADGVHLGQEDGEWAKARSMLGEEAILGRSTHSSDQALEAEEEGFDYIGVGPVFKTPTKPSYEPVGLELVRFASKRVHIPFVAIGGIDFDNVADVVSAGARVVAVVRAVMAAENPKEAARRIKERIL